MGIQVALLFIYQSDEIVLQSGDDIFRFAPNEGDQQSKCCEHGQDEKPHDQLCGMCGHKRHNVGHYFVHGAFSFLIITKAKLLELIEKLLHISITH